MKFKQTMAKTSAILAGGMMFAGSAGAAIIVNQDFDGAPNNVGFDNFSTYTHSQVFYTGNDIKGNSTTNRYGWSPGTTGVLSTTTVDLTTLHTVGEIDGGQISLQASSWIAGYQTNSDYGVIRVSFFTSTDGTGTASSSFVFDNGAGIAPDFWQGSADASGNPDMAIDNLTNNWSFYSNSTTLAAGTRSVSVAWEGHRSGVIGPGGNTIGNDAYIDDVLVETSVSPIPEPSSTALLGLGGLALILRRRK